MTNTVTWDRSASSAPAWPSRLRTCAKASSACLSGVVGEPGACGSVPMMRAKKRRGLRCGRRGAWGRGGRLRGSPAPDAAGRPAQRSGAGPIRQRGVRRACTCRAAGRARREHLDPVVIEGQALLAGTMMRSPMRNLDERHQRKSADDRREEKSLGSRIVDSSRAAWNDRLVVIRAQPGTRP